MLCKLLEKWREVRAPAETFAGAFSLPQLDRYPYRVHNIGNMVLSRAEKQPEESKVIYLGLGLLAIVGMLVTTVLVLKANQLDKLMEKKEAATDTVEINTLPEPETTQEESSESAEAETEEIIND